MSRLGDYEGENAISSHALTMLKPYIRNRSVVVVPASPLIRAVTSAAAKMMSRKHTVGIREVKSHKYEDSQYASSPIPDTTCAFK